MTTLVAWRYHFSDWHARGGPKWHYSGHNCKADLPKDATIEALYTRPEHEQAMEVLRQIAGMKRRTREQKLANACVIFLDALKNEH